MFIIVFNLILFLLFLFLIFVYSMLWPPDSPWAPWWRTNKKTAKAICELAKIREEDMIFDLGCGDGTLLITAAKDYKARGVGIEIDPSRYLVAQLRVIKNKLWSRIEIKRKNFFKIPIGEASIVVVYLVPKTLEKLKTKFLRELKPGTKIISYKYEIDLPLLKYDKENQIRLYQIP